MKNKSRRNAMAAAIFFLALLFAMLGKWTTNESGNRGAVAIQYELQPDDMNQTRRVVQDVGVTSRRSATTVLDAGSDSGAADMEMMIAQGAAGTGVVGASVAIAPNSPNDGSAGGWGGDVDPELRGYILEELRMSILEEQTERPVAGAQ